jgi:hypothetical protein
VFLPTVKHFKGFPQKIILFSQDKQSYQCV